MNKLLIDSRENSELTESIITKCTEMNIPFQKEWLEIGDYVFEDVCFEAKSSFDFLQSVMNKRLWNQMDNMDNGLKMLKLNHLLIKKELLRINTMVQWVKLY